MSSYAPNPSGGTTDHTIERLIMVARAREIMQQYPDVRTCPAELRKDAAILMAAAALLEVHDASGISLDDWIGPRQLITEALELVGLTDDLFLPNGV